LQAQSCHFGGRPGLAEKITLRLTAKPRTNQAQLLLRLYPNQFDAGSGWERAAIRIMIAVTRGRAISSVRLSCRFCICLALRPDLPVVGIVNLQDQNTEW
jgi:hypothetical protein